MPINIIDNFNVNVSKPVDSRMVVANLAARNAISYKYDGMKVFQQDDRKTYTWNSGTSTWSFENSDLSDGYVPIFSPTGLTNSIIYSTASNIGVNANDPKATLQINPSIGFSPPFTIDTQFVHPIIAHNWYYDGSDQYFLLNKGSIKLSFGDSMNVCDYTFKIRKPGDPAGTFVIPLYLNDDGNVGIGNNSISAINASSTLFTGQIPKLEVTTGDSTGAYSEFMILRHPVVDLSTANRSLGYLLKLSDETSAGESSKMGGMMLESTSSLSSNPSLYFLTNDQKRLSIDYNGDINIFNNLSVVKSISIGDTFSCVYDYESVYIYGYVNATASVDVDSIIVPAYSTVQIEVTFVGRLVTPAGMSIVRINQSNKISALYSCDGSGVFTLINNQTDFAWNDFYTTDSIDYGFIDISTPYYLYLKSGYTVSSNPGAIQWDIVITASYNYKIITTV